MIAIAILIAAIMLAVSVSLINTAGTRRRHRRGIDWSGLKSAPPPEPKDTETEDALK